MREMPSWYRNEIGFLPEMIELNRSCYAYWLWIGCLYWREISEPHILNYGHPGAYSCLVRRYMMMSVLSHSLPPALFLESLVKTPLMAFVELPF